MSRNLLSIEKKNEFLRTSNMYNISIRNLIEWLQTYADENTIENLGTICQEKILELALEFEKSGIDFFDPNNTMTMSIIDYLFLKNTVNYLEPLVTKIETKKILCRFQAILFWDIICLKRYHQKCQEIKDFNIEKNIIEVLSWYYNSEPGSYTLEWDTHKEMLINLGYDQIVFETEENLLRISMGFEVGNNKPMVKELSNKGN